MANKTSKDPLIADQGAKPEHRDENSRAKTVETEQSSEKQGAQITENSENKRAKTV